MVSMATNSDASSTAFLAFSPGELQGLLRRKLLASSAGSTEAVLPTREVLVKLLDHDHPWQSAADLMLALPSCVRVDDCDFELTAFNLDPVGQMIKAWRRTDTRLFSPPLERADVTLWIIFKSERYAKATLETTCSVYVRSERREDATSSPDQKNDHIEDTTEKAARTLFWQYFGDTVESGMRCYALGKLAPSELMTLRGKSLPILPAFEQAWIFFVDMAPSANWGHACAYAFIDAKSGQPAWFKALWPPTPSIEREELFRGSGQK